MAPSSRWVAALLVAATVVAMGGTSGAHADSEIVDLDGSACRSLNETACIAARRDRNAHPFGLAVVSGVALDGSSLRVRRLGSNDSFARLATSSDDVPAGDAVLWQLGPHEVAAALPSASVEDLERDGFEARIRVVSSKHGSDNCPVAKFRMRGLSFPRVWQIYDRDRDKWYDLPSSGEPYTATSRSEHLERVGFFCKQ